MQRSKPFGHGVVASSKTCYNDFFALSVTEALIALKEGRCLKNEKKETENEHQTKPNTFKTFPFWNSKHPLPTRSRFLRATVGSTCSALCLHHAHPFVSATEKCQSHARSGGLQDLLQCSDCALSCSVWLLQTKEQLSRLSFSNSGLEAGLPAFQLPCWQNDALPKGRDCCKPMNSCRDWAFSSVGWKWGCQPFSCPCSQNVKHCRKEIYLTCLFKTSIPAVPFWNSKHPVSTRSRFLRATVRSTSSAFCLHHAHPFIAATEKYVSHAEKQKVWSRSCGHQDLLQWSVCALSCGIILDCCKPTNTCRDWAFSNSGLEVGLPAFQLPMFAKCDALPQADLLDMCV